MYWIAFVSFVWGSDAVPNSVFASGPSKDSKQLMRSKVNPVPSAMRRYREAVSLVVESDGRSHQLMQKTRFKVTPVPTQLSAYARWFDKFSTVFGFPVFAAPGVPVWMVEHAAGVLAQYLDWDADGKVNNGKVYEALLQNRGILALFVEDPPNSFYDQEGEDHFRDAIMPKDIIPDWAKTDKDSRPKPKKKVVKADANDIPKTIYIMRVPSESLMGRSSLMESIAGSEDGAIEEIMHMLFDAGYATVYPKVFAQPRQLARLKEMEALANGWSSYVESNYLPASNYSLIAQCMFESIGDCGFAYNNTFKYPHCHGHWHYNDKTCGPDCLVSEYTFRSLTTLLGGYNGCARKDGCASMAEEWEIKTAAELKKLEPHVVELYDLDGKNPYGVPTVLPNGNYQPKSWPDMSLDTRYHSHPLPLPEEDKTSKELLHVVFVVFVSSVMVLIFYICLRGYGKIWCL